MLKTVAPQGLLRRGAVPPPVFIEDEITGTILRYLAKLLFSLTFNELNVFVVNDKEVRRILNGYLSTSTVRVFNRKGIRLVIIFTDIITSMFEQVDDR